MIVPYPFLHGQAQDRRDRPVDGLVNVWSAGASRLHRSLWSPSLPPGPPCYQRLAPWSAFRTETLRREQREGPEL